MSGDSILDSSMLDLFLMEAATHSQALEHGLVDLESKAASKEVIEPLMRAAHSIKGAARIMGLTTAVGLAHAMEDVFVAAQAGRIAMTRDVIDSLLQGTDVFKKLAKLRPEEIASWLRNEAPVMASIQEALGAALSGRTAAPAAAPQAARAPTAAPALPAPPPKPGAVERQEAPRAEPVPDAASGTVLVTAGSLNRLMGLAGECMVEARRLPAMIQGLGGVKTAHVQLTTLLESLAGAARGGSRAITPYLLTQLQDTIAHSRQILMRSMEALDAYAIRAEELTVNLYHAGIAARMRPFSDGTKGFPRLVRDVARQLGKQIRLEIRGEMTRVDRDILTKLEAPLNHILRNACDHGIESPAERRAAGKSEDGLIVLEAVQKGGMLHVSVTDDGKGIDPEHIRRRVVQRNLAAPEIAKNLTQAELMEFLFLPGFSTAAAVTELSGRGVGLDVVQSMIQEVGGAVSLESETGRGTIIRMKLPLTLSVLKTLLVDVAGDAYAFPLSRIDRILKVPVCEIGVVQDRQYCALDGLNVGLIHLRQPLGLQPPSAPGDELAIVVVSDRLDRYGLVVDRLLAQSELVVHPLDQRLGKIPNISAGAILEDGTPVLIVDVDDLVRSVDHLLGGGRPAKIRTAAARTATRRVKRLLVVDDSITVRQVERRLLENRGYEVDTAVDGMDGWNRIQSGSYDLVISDVDMPRMNGIELVRRIKTDPDTKHLPVMIVSYKDREEDRLKGLEAGATYYMTKSTFHDESLLNAVIDLVGEP